MLLKCCTQYVSKFGKSSSGHRTEKGQFSFQSQRKATKEGSNYHTISLILNVSKVMFKILQDRLQQYVNQELPDVQAGFRKGRGTRDKIANIPCIMKKGNSRKISTSLPLTTQKPLTVWITTNWKILEEKGMPVLPASWETYMQVKKQQNITWNNWLVQNWERSMTRLYIVTLFI